jgi:hypothetical protein
VRSVQRESVGCVIEPRKKFIVWADTVLMVEGNTLADSDTSRVRATPGSKSDGTLRRGFPGTWETLASTLRVLSGGEGNRVTGEGRKGVGSPHSTEEDGELTRRTRQREGGGRSWNRRRER